MIARYDGANSHTPIFDMLYSKVENPGRTCFIPRGIICLVEASNF